MFSAHHVTRHTNPRTSCAGQFVSRGFVVLLRKINPQSHNLQTAVVRGVMPSLVVRFMETEKLIGNTAKFSFLEPCTWTLQFNSGAELSNFSLCRIIKEKQLLACTTDQGEWFGLGEPYSAETEMNNLISNGVVSEVSHGSCGNDLVFSFNNGISIEILSISTGYETWEYRTQEGSLYVAMGSGNINEF